MSLATGTVAGERHWLRLLCSTEHLCAQRVFRERFWMLNSCTFCVVYNSPCRLHWLSILELIDSARGFSWVLRAMAASISANIHFISCYFKILSLYWAALGHGIFIRDIALRTLGASFHGSTSLTGCIFIRPDMPAGLSIHRFLLLQTHVFLLGVDFALCTIRHVPLCFWGWLQSLVIYLSTTTALSPPPLAQRSYSGASSACYA